MKIFSENRKMYSHLSRISLNRASYLDIGHYYCGPLVTDLKLVQRNFKNIYIFVRGKYVQFKFESKEYLPNRIYKNTLLNRL